MRRRTVLHQKRAGFSLVELLVVIGIVVVLIALLLPAAVKARRHALQVACASNLRQVGLGFIAYANDHKGWFPAPADALGRPDDEDWIHWQPGRDIRQSRLFPYIGMSPGVLKCPLGVPERGPTTVSGGGGPFTYPAYPFSYSVNIKFTGCSASARFGIWSDTRPCRLGEAVNPSQKILAIEEDVTGINDGAWWTTGSDPVAVRSVGVSVMHDRGREYGGGQSVDTQYWFRGRGNVVFADGHCEFLMRGKVSSGPYSDPRSREPPP